VKRVVSRYAYKRTVLMGMKAAASANGVLAPNWFRWLKAVDRVTWYALCDIGMDVASVEACGLRSHWLSEVVANSAIMNPRIESALVGIKTALGEMVDEESED
ncbi:TPA: hypothetical protein NHR74_002462, partial [Pseudomonas aeruginosa]|nr:hypothetical protein [Pseudomonas aeruginosa]